MTKNTNTLFRSNSQNSFETPTRCRTPVKTMQPRFKHLKSAKQPSHRYQTNEVLSKYSKSCSICYESYRHIRLGESQCPENENGITGADLKEASRRRCNAEREKNTASVLQALEISKATDHRKHVKYSDFKNSEDQRLKEPRKEYSKLKEIEA